MTLDTHQNRPLGRFWRVAPVVVVLVVGLASAALDAYLRTDAGRPLLEGEVLPETPALLVTLLVLVQAAALWVRDRLPVAVLLVVTAADLVLLVLTEGTLSVGSIAVIIAAYTVSRRGTGRSAYLWVGATALASVAVEWITVQSSPDIPAGWELPFAAIRAALVYLVPALIAEVVASRARSLLALQDRAEAAERERDRRAREAVQQERALMARELHDIAAHHLSGIIIGAQAAGTLIASEPDRAREYIRTVARDAQLTLANLRQTVGLLRSDDAAELAPAPSIAQIPQLLAELRDTGMTITEEWVGDVVPLGPVAESAAYRMVQESLANARQHAPGASCAVRVETTSSGIILTVTNYKPVTPGQPADQGGHGLLGMRERATLTGAHLTVGPTPEGGWRNELTLPLPDVAPDSVIPTASNSTPADHNRSNNPDGTSAE
jgi:signal transduction histidine kinase